MEDQDYNQMQHQTLRGKSGVEESLSPATSALRSHLKKWYPKEQVSDIEEEINFHGNEERAYAEDGEEGS